MSQYTIELGELLELGYQLRLDDYPIFDENYREELNNKIIDHFYFREIGQETPDRFNKMLARKMREIMPYYNQRYLSTLIQFDPLAADYFQQSQNEKRRQRLKEADTTRFSQWEQEQAAAASKRKGQTDTDQQGSHTQTDQGTYEKNGLKDLVRDENRTDDKVTDREENSVRTDDLTENGQRQTNTAETRTDNLTETTSKTTDRKGNEQTQSTENLSDTIDTEQTVTNDLTKNQQGSTTTDGNRSEQGATSSVFSETPQNNLNVALTMKQDGTSTTSVSGYATTVTQNNERKSATDHETAENTALTTDTGNVKTEGNSQENRNLDANTQKDYTETVTEEGERKNTGTVETVGDENVQNTVSNTGTVKNDATGKITESDVIHTHGTDNETWSEKGENQDTSDYEETETVNQTQTETEDAQNARKKNAANLQNRLTDQETTNQADVVTWYKGRRGMNPADLLTAYRDTFINVDMEIIEELEPLFMGLW